MRGLFLPSEKLASGEPKHTPKRVQAPCVCAEKEQVVSHQDPAEPCQSKEMQTDKAMSVQLPSRIGNDSVLKGRHLGLNALV